VPKESWPKVRGRAYVVTVGSLLELPLGFHLFFFNFNVFLIWHFLGYVCDPYLASNISQVEPHFQFDKKSCWIQI
jgi:hypothetical protein